MSEKSESIKTCYSSSVLFLGNVYGSASWKRLGLCTGLCSEQGGCSAAVLLRKPPQECAPRSLRRQPRGRVPQRAAVQELEEKRVRARRELAGSPGSKEDLTCKYWTVRQVQRHSLLLLLPTEGIAQVLLIMRSLQPPCPPPACQLLFPRMVPLTLTGCHRGSAGCAAVTHGGKSPRWLLRPTVARGEDTHSSGNNFAEHPDGWDEVWYREKDTEQKVQPWKRVKIS